MSSNYRNGQQGHCYLFDSGLHNTGVANGQISYQNIKTVTLEASNQGVSYTPIGAGIRIDDSTGSSTILITQIQSDGGSLPPVNTPPQIDKPIADRTMNEDDVLVWEVPSDAFKDINTNDRLNYTVVQANGQALPAWMDFNPVTGQLIAAPGNAQVETMNSIALCAMDTRGKVRKCMQFSITDSWPHKQASRCDTQSIVRTSV